MTPVYLGRSPNPKITQEPQPMWSLTCVPTNVYNTLYKFKPVFRCVQARHFCVFCWLLIALILDNGKGTLKELCHYLPPKLRYWTLMRMVRSGQWDASVLVDEMSCDVLGWLPAAVVVPQSRLITPGQRTILL